MPRGGPCSSRPQTDSEDSTGQDSPWVPARNQHRGTDSEDHQPRRDDEKSLPGEPYHGQMKQPCDDEDAPPDPQDQSVGGIKDGVRPIFARPIVPDVLGNKGGPGYQGAKRRQSQGLVGKKRFPRREEAAR